MNTNVKSFESAQDIASYYNDRFEANYMESWDDHIEAKVRLFFSQVELPTGKWLDFGCGQASLTKLLKDIHPQSNVEGCDISSVAIRKASEQNPNIPFSVWKEDQLSQRYHLIFSHHVLEHVLNIDETLNQLDSITYTNGIHCHILPCGNKGSLEWQVSKSTQNGFESNGRFFFEEDGHLRRLSFDQLFTLYESRGYRLVLSQFSNQYYGAFKWLIDLGPGFICEFANPKNGKSLPTSLWLYKLRMSLLFLWRMRYLSRNRPTARFKRFLYPVVLPFAKIYVSRFSRLLEGEAINQFSNPAGSEMLVCFLKEGHPASKTSSHP